MNAPLGMPLCSCTRELYPVCGADGVTYQNKCLAVCNGTEVVRNGNCPAGEQQLVSACCRVVEAAASEAVLW